ncbi:MAG: hypothetical protein KGS48_03850 [Bacteroidetes bacterium]|nr:hypothetical protein [Bacteroidota bacterium]
MPTINYQQLCRIERLIGCAVVLLVMMQCRLNKEDHSYDFFTSPRFNGDYFKTLPLGNFDSSFMCIKAQVPEDMQAWACEHLYYILPEDCDYNTRFYFLDCLEKRFNDPELLAFADLIRGELYIDQAQFEHAEQCLKRSTIVCQKSGNMLMLGDSKRFQARALLLQGGYPESIRLLLEAFEIYEKNKDRIMDRKFNVRLALADAYRESREYREALRWCGIAMNLIETDNPDIKAAFCGFEKGAYEKFAETYLDLFMPDSALMYAQKSLAIRSKYKISGNQMNSNLLLSRIYLAKGKSDSALYYVTLAQNQMRTHSNQARETELNKMLGNVYLSLNQLDWASFYFNKCLPTRDTALMAYLEDRKAQIACLKGNFQTAYSSMNHSKILYDAAYNGEKSRLLSKQKIRYELQQQEEKIATIKKQGKTTLFITFLALLGLFWVSVIAFLLQKNQKRKARIYEQELELFEIREKLHQQELVQSKTELEAKQEQLRQSTRLHELKNLMIQELEQRLSQIGSAAQTDTGIRRVRILTDHDWQHFLEQFSQIAPGLLLRLKTSYPNLTTAETRLFLLIKLYFDSREISEASGISLESVWRSRNRLRKKLGLSEQENLDQFVQQF